jgi:hypothetical protein
MDEVIVVKFPKSQPNMELWEWSKVWKMKWIFVMVSNVGGSRVFYLKMPPVRTKCWV